MSQILKFPNRTKAALIFSGILGGMANMLFVPNIAPIADSFPNEPELLSKLLISLPPLSMAIMALIGGRIIDRMGRLKLYYICLIVYGIFGLSGFFIPNLKLLLATRFILGLAMGGMMTVGNTLAADYFDGEERSKFFGLRAGLIALSGIIFFLIGSLITQHFGWRCMFLMFTLAGILAPLFLKSFVEPDKELLIEEDKNYGTNNNEEKIDSVVPYRTIGLIMITAFFSYMIFFILPTQMATAIASVVEDVKEIQIGISVACATVFAGIASFFHNKLQAYLHYLYIHMIALCIISGGFFMLSHLTEYYHSIIGMAISGLGIGLMLPNLALWLYKISPALKRGTYGGTLLVFVFLGQFISPIMFNLIKQDNNYTDTFRTISILCIIVVGVIYLSHRLLCKNEEEL